MRPHPALPLLRSTVGLCDETFCSPVLRWPSMCGRGQPLIRRLGQIDLRDWWKQLICLLGDSWDLSKIIESQNGLGWEGPFQAIQSNPLPSAGTSSAGLSCSEPCPAWPLLRPAECKLSPGCFPPLACWLPWLVAGVSFAGIPRSGVLFPGICAQAMPWAQLSLGVAFPEHQLCPSSLTTVTAPATQSSGGGGRGGRLV